MHINILVYDGFDELDAIGPYEVFQNASRYDIDICTSLVTIDEQKTVVGANGLQIVPDGILTTSDLEKSPDMILVPGGGWATGDGGVRREIELNNIPRVIRSHWKNGTRIAAVCTGAFLLEKAGMLNDIPATTHSAAMNDLEEKGVRVVEHRIVDTGDILTSGGVTSGIDLALHIISQEFNDGISEEIADFLAFNQNNDVIYTH